MGMLGSGRAERALATKGPVVRASNAHIGRRAIRSTFFSAILAISTVAGVSCRAQPTIDIATLVNGISPLGDLSGVTLRMTAQQLQQLRPSVRNMPYTGFDEVVGGYSVRYKYSSAVRDDIPVASHDKLEHVSAWYFAGADSAKAEFRKSLGRMVAGVGVPRRCRRSVDGNTVVAEWNLGGVRLFLQGSWLEREAVSGLQPRDVPRVVWEFGAGSYSTRLGDMVKADCNVD